MDKYTDGQLYIRYYNKNDQDAFRIIFEKHRDGLLLFLYGMVKNMDDAEELMMDTFAVLSSKTARYTERKDVSFKTWLYAIGRNQARMFLRKRKTVFSELNEEVLYETEPDKGDSPEQSLIKDERNAHLYKALKLIDTEQSQVLYLMYFEDMKPDEISRIMKKTKKQIYNLTARGKTALKETLERMGYTWDM